MIERYSKSQKFLANTAWNAMYFGRSNNKGRGNMMVKAPWHPAYEAKHPAQIPTRQHLAQTQSSQHLTQMPSLGRRGS